MTVDQKAIGKKRTTVGNLGHMRLCLEDPKEKENYCRQLWTFIRMSVGVFDTVGIEGQWLCSVVDAQLQIKTGVEFPPPFGGCLYSDRHVQATHPLNCSLITGSLKADTLSWAAFDGCHVPCCVQEEGSLVFDWLADRSPYFEFLLRTCCFDWQC